MNTTECLKKIFILFKTFNLNFGYLNYTMLEKSMIKNIQLFCKNDVFY